MNGEMRYTDAERRLPKMRVTYGTIKHSHNSTSYSENNKKSDDGSSVSSGGMNSPTSINSGDGFQNSSLLKLPLLPPLKNTSLVHTSNR